MLRLAVKQEKDLRLRYGHPWVYRGDLVDVPTAVPDGDEADVVDARGSFIGRGLLSAHGRVVCRILTRRREPLDRAFFRKRILAAHELRCALGLPSKRTDAYRLVFAEGDRLSGLLVDRLGDYVVIQTPVPGTDRRKGEIVDILREVVSPRGICERNDTPTRTKEGLERTRSWLFGAPEGPVQVRENGIIFEIDPLGAMKTGHFCDQRDNRLLLERIARGREVLDVFCYTGGFGLAAARAGARRVLSIDGAADAIEAARANARLNGVADRIDHQVADGFEALEALDREKRRFDVVVLDPPAFAKKRAHVDKALGAYRAINRRALKLIPVGGYLLTCSCSYNMSRRRFREALLDAAGEAGRTLRLIAEGSAGPDHPVLLNVPETDYLKALLVQVVEKL